MEAVLTESAIQLRAGYPKFLGRSHLIASDFVHRLCNRLLLEIPEIGTSQRWSIIPVGERQMLGVNRRSFAHDGRPLDRVAKFADVSWPVIGEQRLLGVRRQLRVPVAIARNALEEMLGKQQDIQASLT